MTPFHARHCRGEGTVCPYAGCRDERAHGGPHRFEQPDVERFRHEGAAVERRRVRKAVAALTEPTLGLKGGVSRREVLAIVEESA